MWSFHVGVLDRAGQPRADRRSDRRRRRAASCGCRAPADRAIARSRSACTSRTGRASDVERHVRAVGGARRSERADELLRHDAVADHRRERVRAAGRRCARTACSRAAARCRRRAGCCSASFDWRSGLPYSVGRTRRSTSSGRATSSAFRPTRGSSSASSIGSRSSSCSRGSASALYNALNAFLPTDVQANTRLAALRVVLQLRVPPVPPAGPVRALAAYGRPQRPQSAARCLPRRVCTVECSLRSSRVLRSSGGATVPTPSRLRSVVEIEHAVAADPENLKLAADYRQLAIASRRFRPLDRRAREAGEAEGQRAERADQPGAGVRRQGADRPATSGVSTSGATR